MPRSHGSLMEIWALSKRTGMAPSQQFASFQDLKCAGNGAHRLDAKRIMGHAGCCLLNPLGPTSGKEKAENAAWLHQKDFSRLGAVSQVKVRFAEAKTNVGGAGAEEQGWVRQLCLGLK